MKQSGHLNPSEETGTECLITSTYVEQQHTVVDAIERKGPAVVLTVAHSEQEKIFFN